MTLPRRVKQPSESRVYDFDFTDNLAAGETLTTVTAFTQSTLTGAGTLTLGSTAVSGAIAQGRVSAGVAGEVYKVTMRVNTSLSNILEGECEIEVVEL